MSLVSQREQNENNGEVIFNFSYFTDSPCQEIQNGGQKEKITTKNDDLLGYNTSIY